MERATAVDTAWYRMESHRNPVDVAAVLVFPEGLTMEALRGTIVPRLLRWERFRQRIVPSRLPLRRPRWIADPAFRPARHLHHHTLASSDRPALEALIGQLSTGRLPPDRPLWALHLIDGFEGGTVLFARLHHCMGDGFALAHTLLAVADDAPSASRPPRSRRRVRALAAAKAFAELVLLPFDPPSALRGALTGARRVTWSDPLPLDRIKALAKAHGATLNDLLLAALAGALRRELGAPDEDLRAIVPVNLRPARSIEEMDDSLGNRFGLVFVRLPVGVDGDGDGDDGAAGRIAAVHSEVERLKRSMEAPVALGILDAIGRAPLAVEHVVERLFARKGSLVVTNVPGPRERLRFAGSPLGDLVFWVPHPVHLGLGVSILSYAGEVRIGVRTDAGVIADPAPLVRAFVEELEALEA